MAEIIQFPKDRIKRDITAFKTNVAGFRAVLEGLQNKGIGGLFMLECGPIVEGGVFNISKVALANFICDMLEDEETLSIIGQIRREREGDTNGR